MQTFVIKYRSRSGGVKKEERLAESYFDASASTCRTHGIESKDIISIHAKTKVVKEDED